MNEKTAMLELQELQSDINNLLVPDEFSKPTLTVGSIKAQIISKFCLETNKKLSAHKHGLWQALKDGCEIVGCRFRGYRTPKDLDTYVEYSKGDVSAGTWIWMICMVLLLIGSGIPAYSIPLESYILKPFFLFLTTISLIFNPCIFFARRAFFDNGKEYGRAKAELSPELDQNLAKLDSDSGYLVAQIREHLGQTATEFRSRFIKAEANFKQAASEPRIKAQEAIARLERQKEKVRELSDKVSCPENKARITTKIDEAIQGYQEFIEELAPKEERLLTTAILVKDQLQQLQTRVNGLESIQTEYESYQSIMDELSEHNIKLETLRNEHSSNMDFVQGQLNELCQDVLDIHKTINDCRYLLPGLDLVETATLPAHELKQIAVSVG